jgi:hypothetical protein
MIVIISCGAQKAPDRQKAQLLYTGPYFQDCLAYARTLAPDKDIWILSAKHGLLGLNDELDPYNLKMGEPGSITTTELDGQAEFYGLREEQVVVIGGGLYVEACRQIWPDVQAPLEGRGGMGQQRQWMRTQTYNARKVALRWSNLA